MVLQRLPLQNKIEVSCLVVGIDLPSHNNMNKLIHLLLTIAIGCKMHNIIRNNHGAKMKNSIICHFIFGFLKDQIAICKNNKLRWSCFGFHLNLHVTSMGAMNSTIPSKYIDHNNNVHIKINPIHKRPLAKGEDASQGWFSSFTIKWVTTTHQNKVFIIRMTLKVITWWLSN